MAAAGQFHAKSLVWTGWYQKRFHQKRFYKTLQFTAWPPKGKKREKGKKYIKRKIAVVIWKRKCYNTINNELAG